MAAWQGIPWTKVQRHVFRLQKRIYQATQRGDVRTVRKLQNLLTKSWYARLLAVRRVTQENRGKRTAGIDGAKSLTAPQRWRLARQLRLDGKATPLRRASIISSATLELALRTSRRGRQINRVQNRCKQGAWFLTKKPLCRCRAVRACQKKVVNRGQAGPLTR
jgi:retron-type reverse transcriptase